MKRFSCQTGHHWKLRGHNKSHPVILSTRNQLHKPQQSGRPWWHPRWLLSPMHQTVACWKVSEMNYTWRFEVASDSSDHQIRNMPTRKHETWSKPLICRPSRAHPIDSICRLLDLLHMLSKLITTCKGPALVKTKRWLMFLTSTTSTSLPIYWQHSEIRDQIQTNTLHPVEAQEPAK